MKTTTWMVMILLTGVLALAGGCGKSAPKVQDWDEVNGVKVDLPKFQRELGSAVDQQAQFSTSMVIVRFKVGEYAVVLAELNKLANNPTLTPTQKKVVLDMTEQVKQLMAKGPAR
jgi:hypothetical protein